eukprot:28930-Pelagomonas_calceolata.AAC.1
MDLFCVAGTVQQAEQFNFLAEACTAFTSCENFRSLDFLLGAMPPSLMRNNPSLTLIFTWAHVRETSLKKDPTVSAEANRGSHQWSRGLLGATKLMRIGSCTLSTIRPGVRITLL